MTKQSLQQFFKDHPQLTSNSFAKELKSMGINVSQRNLYGILYENQKLTSRIAEKLLPLMVKYGYREETMLDRALKQSEINDKIIAKK